MEKKLRTPVVPAILMILVVLGQISELIVHIANIVEVQKNLPRYYPPHYLLFTIILTLVGIGVSLALCIALFAKARRGILVAIFGGRILSSIAFFVLEWLYFRVDYDKFLEGGHRNIFFFCLALLSCLLSVAAAATIAVYALIVSKNPPRKIRIPFFIPATMQFLAVFATNIIAILSWINMIRQLMEHGAGSYISSSLLSTLVKILGPYIYAIALLSLGRWLRDPYVKAKSIPVAEHQSVAAPATTPAVTSVDETVDALKKYKDLLDCGIITQEEFDAKKKEILGL